MSEEMKLTEFDSWFNDDGPAALVIVESLQSIVEDEAVIFPPTYAPEQGASNKKSEYVIDPLKDGRNVCQIDSVGAQANRLEPIFKTPPYDKLVPQVCIKVKDGHQVNLLDAGHRAADAIVRFSTLGERLANGFDAYLKGDASKLAAIAPTSLVFGAWDSRGTQAKTPRILSSVIRAYDVEPLSRSAQYIPPVEYTNEILGEAAGLTDDQRSEFGLTHVPAPKALGGILVRGEIRREAILNLVSLRAIGAISEDGALDESKTLVLRRYILGLGLVAFTKAMIHNLRQGCLLVGAEGKPASWKLVYATGKRETFQMDHGAALTYAQNAAEEFMKAFPIDTSEKEVAEEDGLRKFSGQFAPKLAKAAADEKNAKKEAKKAGKKGGKGATA